MKRVVVGLSGGVDSSVAAYLLKEQGYDVVGLFMRNWKDTTGTLEGDCPWYDDHLFAELVAKRLDIPFHMIDLSDEYRRRVVDYMFAEYARGRTPNPDVLCNREIKFDAFLNAALELGADFVATGHYCRREEIRAEGRTIHRLLAGSDSFRARSFRSDICSSPRSGASLRNSIWLRLPARTLRASVSWARSICPFSCSSSSQPRTATSSRSRPDGRVIVRCLRTLRSGGWPSLSATNLRTVRAWDVTGALTSSRSDSARA